MGSVVLKNKDLKYEGHNGRGNVGREKICKAVFGVITA